MSNQEKGAGGSRFNLSRPTSLFLDVLRLAAALMVLASHCDLFWYPRQASVTLAYLGHRAVIIFFVLSGYVIAYSTFHQSRDVRAYVLARLSRLYSVVLPALFLTLLLQSVGAMLNPLFYHQFKNTWESLRYLLTAFFLQSLWMSNTSPPTNGPFWSLGYEFWYYAIFGAAVFIKPFRWKLTAILILSLVAGIDILLLMPSWLMGMALYLKGRPSSSAPWAVLGFIIALMVNGIAFLFLPEWPMQSGSPPFFYSNAFVSDGLLGLLLTALLWTFDQAFGRWKISETLHDGVRWAADHTFSLYLYHFPILLFVTATLPFNPSNCLEVGIVTGVLLSIIILLSTVTEQRRSLWHRLFARAWDFVLGGLSKKMPHGEPPP